MTFPSAKKLFIVCSIGFAAACGAQSGMAENHVIEMRGLEFAPAVLKVAVGDTVTWVNADVTPHTATARNGAWDSGTMEKGDEWSIVIDEAGSTDYACNFHPSMTGVINAE